LIIPASAKDISLEKSSHFKPDQCALLLIDHQVGTIQLIKNITADQSIRNAVTLAKAALAFDMPIVSRRRMERAGVWLTSTNTMVAELVGNWATPQGMALVSLLAADPPMLPVY
jgi:nicotinamidase-related amidase